MKIHLNAQESCAFVNFPRVSFRIIEIILHTKNYLPNQPVWLKNGGFVVVEN